MKSLVVAVCFLSQSFITAIVTIADEKSDPSVISEAIQTKQSAIERDLGKQLAAIPAISDKSSQAIDQYSRRGDLRMFLGRYAEAESDYQAMVKLDPAQDASHWRLGIALFFADKPRDAAGQFDKYHSFDNVDRENGIWRYLSHYRAFGRDKAKAELLRYERDDRPPFPEVYRLFDESLTPAQVLAAIRKDLPNQDRESRLFYSHLYIGMHAVVKKDKAVAVEHLKLATENSWPATAGYGPHYMWHVGRLQYLDLVRATNNNGTR